MSALGITIALSVCVPSQAPVANIDALIQQLDSANEYVRGRALSELARMGEAARPAVPAMAQLLSDESARNRVRAAVSLSRLGPNSQTAMLKLFDALDSDDARLRLKAVEALGRLGAREPMSVLPRVAKHDKDENVCRAAEKAIEATVSLEDNVHLLVAMLQSLDARTQEYTLERISHLGRKAETAVPVLVDLLESPTNEPRLRAIATLGRLAKDVGAAKNALVSALSSDDPIVQSSAAGALAKAGMDNCEILYEALRDCHGSFQGHFYPIPRSKSPVPKLSHVAVRSYGKVRSLSVIQVVDAKSLIASTESGVWLRIREIATAGLTDDSVVSADILIVGTWQYVSVLGAKRTIFDAVPLACVKRGLSRQDFARLLRRGLLRIPPHLSTFAPKN